MLHPSSQRFDKRETLHLDFHQQWHKRDYDGGAMQRKIIVLQFKLLSVIILKPVKAFLNYYYFLFDVFKIYFFIFYAGI